jgi:hypothetical protein
MTTATTAAPSGMATTDPMMTTTSRRVGLFRRMFR